MIGKHYIFVTFVRSLPHYRSTEGAATESSPRPNFDFEINKGNSVVERNAFLDSRLVR